MFRPRHFLDVERKEMVGRDCYRWKYDLNEMITRNAILGVREISIFQDVVVTIFGEREGFDVRKYLLVILFLLKRLSSVERRVQGFRKILKITQRERAMLSWFW